MTLAVSVIVPAYHAGKYLKRCLDSIEAQTVQDFEIILALDDPSYDNSLEIAKNHTLFPKIKYSIENQKTNPAVARNRGMRKSEGEYIAFIDADDEWLPDHLHNAITYLSQHENTIYLAYGEITFSDSHKKLRVYPVASTMAVRNKDLVLFREELTGAEDGQWQDDMIAYGKKLAVLPVIDARYHKHPGQLSEKTLVYNIKRYAITREYRKLITACSHILLKPLIDLRHQYIKSPCDRCLNNWGCPHQNLAWLRGCDNRK